MIKLIILRCLSMLGLPSLFLYSDPLFNIISRKAHLYSWLTLRMLRSQLEVLMFVRVANSTSHRVRMVQWLPCPWPIIRRTWAPIGSLSLFELLLHSCYGSWLAAVSLIASHSHSYSITPNVVISLAGSAQWYPWNCFFFVSCCGSSWFL
jgi:hypothetical protein